MSFKLKKKKKEAVVQKLDFQEVVTDTTLVEDTRLRLNELSHNFIKTKNFAIVEKKNNLLGEPSDLAKIISDIKPVSINKEVVL